MGWRQYLGLAGLLAAVIAVQQGAHAADWDFLLTPLTMSAYYGLLVLGLCVLLGYAGQVSLGHAGFFAIGGYTVAALTTHNLAPYAGHTFVSVLSRLGVLTERVNYAQERLLVWHPWAAAVAAVVFAILVAYLIGIPVLRLKGHYLAMATLGFGMIVQTVTLAVEVLGGADGISEVPAFPLAGGLAVSGLLKEKVPNYYIAWALVLAGMLLLLQLIHSRTGRALRALHGAEDAAAASGVDTARYKLGAFVLSAVFAAVAGIFMTHYNASIGPSEAGVMKSIRYVAIVAVGGMANLWGALVAAVALNFLSLRGYFGTYDDAVFGAILVGVMLFAPEGLLRLGIFGRVAGQIRAWRRGRSSA